jgi:hypothetical protein
MSILDLVFYFLFFKGFFKIVGEFPKSFSKFKEFTEFQNILGKLQLLEGNPKI